MAKLKVIFMDDTTSDLFDEKGPRGVRKEYEKNGNANYEVVERAFDTEAERTAYIQALYDMTMGCWTQYDVLDNRCRL